MSRIINPSTEFESPPKPKTSVVLIEEQVEREQRTVITDLDGTETVKDVSAAEAAHLEEVAFIEAEEQKKKQRLNMVRGVLYDARIWKLRQQQQAKSLEGKYSPDDDQSPANDNERT